MSLDRISAQLQQFKKASIASKKEVNDFCHESPLLRTKREVQKELARAEQYRASILKNVTTFGGLTQEALISAAQSMEEVYFVKGDDIIEQDDIGDSFFVLEQGAVVVTRKANTRDAYEKPRELAKLSQNAHFGEIALLTAEPRSATVTVVSDTAKCLRMTKAKFDELLATTNKLHAENRRLIGRDVLDQVPLFRSLSAVNKKKLLDSMIPMTYLPSSYICRQSTAGNTFYIITEGHCRVTVNCEDKTEKEVGKLRAGDFFGHVALIEANNRRTANVISVDTVSCLTLSRTDFNRLLANLKVKLLEHQSGRTNNIKGAGDLLQTSSLANKRRISMYNTHGHRDENRISNLFKRFTKFITESLWNTLYSRMYREMLLDPGRQIDYGVVAETVMRENNQRYSAVTALSEEAQRILEMDPPRRSMADHAFVMGLLRQRNDLREKLCKSWPAHQFGVLCKRVKLQKFMPFKKIFEIDSTGTAAYLIVRGCVRLYSKSSNTGNDAHAPKMYFEQDLGPGEVFGEAALGGIHTRMQLAQAVCHVDAIVIDDADFMAAQDKDSAHMGTEERQRFLAAVPLFKNWDSYKLLRLAHALIQEEVNKGVVLTQHGKPCKDLYFIVNGRMDVVTSLEKRYVITPLLKHDYIGESSIINKFIKSTANKLCEEYYSVAVTKVEVLILPDAAFTLFDLHSVDVVRSTFMAKAEWRRQRVRAMKYERAKMRKHMHYIGKECAALHDFPVDKEFLSEDQIKMVEDTHGRSTWARLQAAKLATGAGSGSRPSSPSPTGHEEGAGSPVRSRPASPLGRPTSALPDLATIPGNMNATFPGPGTGTGTLLGAIAPTIAPAARRAGSARRPKSAVATVLANPAITGQNAPVQKLSDIEDIPTIFVQDMDRFMVSITCRTDRDRAKFASTVSNALRPKSARAREFAEKTLCENTVISKRTDVLAVLEDKDTTRSKLVIRNRRNSAAFTAFALLNPSDTRVRPHTAGQLQGMRPIERPGRQTLEGLGTRSADSMESSGAQGPGHIATHDILHESRQRAMQSGGVDLEPSTPMGSLVRSSLPAVNSPPPSGKAVTHVVAFADQAAQAARCLHEEMRRLPNVAGRSIHAGDSATLTAMSTHSAAGTGTGTGTADAHADFDDELDHDAFDHEGDPSGRLERGNHTPFGSPNTSKRKESVTATTSSAASGTQARRASMSLRGSLCIPASSSYADTLSRSNITPKSAMAMKLEATVDKYIYKKQQVA